MSETLRWGILGTGNIARQFCADLRNASRCQLQAVGSRKAETASAFASANGIPVAAGSYAELLAQGC